MDGMRRECAIPKRFVRSATGHYWERISYSVGGVVNDGMLTVCVTHLIVRGRGFASSA